MLRGVRQEAGQEVETRAGEERGARTVRRSSRGRWTVAVWRPEACGGHGSGVGGYTRLIPGRPAGSDPTWRDVSRRRGADEGSPRERRSSSSSGDLSCDCGGGGGGGQGSFSLGRDGALSDARRRYRSDTKVSACVRGRLSGRSKSGPLILVVLIRSDWLNEAVSISCG